MKHVFKLTKEEKAMEAAVNRADIKPVTKKESEKLKQIARNTQAPPRTLLGRTHIYTCSKDAILKLYAIFFIFDHCH